MTRNQRVGRLAVAVAMLLMVFHATATARTLAQTDFPASPDDTASVVQLWMVAFGILVTVLAGLFKLAPKDLPDLTKKAIVVVASLVLAAIGLAVQQNLFPESLVRAALNILIVSSGIYALFGKMLINSVAGEKSITVKANTDVTEPIPPSKVVDTGH